MPEGMSTSDYITGKTEPEWDNEQSEGGWLLVGGNGTNKGGGSQEELQCVSKDGAGEVQHLVYNFENGVPLGEVKSKCTPWAKQTWGRSGAEGMKCELRRERTWESFSGELGWWWRERQKQP